jgi:hypothetical protein
MSAHSVQQPMVRLTILVTPEQKAALAADAAKSGKAMGQIMRDDLDRKYYENPTEVAGWHVTATVKRPEVVRDVSPARARLREWISRLGSRR